MAQTLTFGRYEAMFHIASGGMAEVFAARLRGPAGFEKLVAIKRLLPDHTDDNFVTMFKDEARLAAQITSPHVVQTLELGRSEADGALYLVMELVVGVTLFELCVSVLSSPLRLVPVPIAAEIVAQAARGMGDAHNATTRTGEPLEVVHRDISPQNILCGVDGRIRVTDFGIARAVSRRTETAAGQLKGKVAYVSPEQARGKPLDHRSDVFSLGVVAWEVLTGKSLFNTGDAMETIKRALTLDVPSPRELRPDIPEPLARAVMWALERDLSRRCPSATAFEDAVRTAFRPASRADLANFVRGHGGDQLHRIQREIRAVEKGDHGAVLMPLKGSESRIVPNAPITSNQLMGSPTNAKIKQRELPTHEVDPEEVPHQVGSPSAQTSSKAMALAGAGVVGWLVAGGLIGMSCMGGEERVEPPLEYEEVPTLEANQESEGNSETNTPEGDEATPETGSEGNSTTGGG